MKCPHCNGELKMAPRVEHNVDCYGKPALGATECCNKLVTVYPIRNIVVVAYTGDRTVDDWGVDVSENLSAL